MHETGIMFSHGRVLAVAKDLEDAHAYEDAHYYDAASGRVAIADGVSRAIFSDRWARVLVGMAVSAPPADLSVSSVLEWLRDCRKSWRSQIDFAKLAPNQLQKLAESGGAFSTLLWAEVVPASMMAVAHVEGLPERLNVLEDDASGNESAVSPPGAEVAAFMEFDSLESDSAEVNAGEIIDSGNVVAEPCNPIPAAEAAPIGDGSALSVSFEEPEWTLKICAMGDCNLFLVRNELVVESFPMKNSEEFGGAPQSLCSIPSKRDEHFDFRTHVCACRPGDWLVLCTDAVAQHLLRRIEEHDHPPWGSWWDMSEAAFIEDLSRWRDERRIRRDDSTMLLLRIADALPPSEYRTETALDGAEQPEPESAEGLYVTGDASMNSNASAAFPTGVTPPDIVPVRSEIGCGREVQDRRETPEYPEEPGNRVGSPDSDNTSSNPVQDRGGDPS
jgi:hypothetical protein